MDKTRVLYGGVERRDFDPRLAQGSSVDPDHESAIALTPRQSVREWVAQNGRGGLPGLGEDPDHFRLGRMVRGALTGAWDGAEHEQRALC
jgi:hypothetical protein